MYQITFGSSGQRSIYLVDAKFREQIEKSLKVRGHENVSTIDTASDSEPWEGREQLRLISGTFHPQDPIQPLYLAFDEETEAAVTDAVMTLTPKAVMEGRWIVKPE